MRPHNYDYNHRVEVEECILGAILIDGGRNGIRHLGQQNHKDLLQYLYDHGFSNSQFFAEQIHKDIFEAILTCLNNDTPVDIVTVGQHKPRRYVNEGYRHQANSSFDFNIIQLTQKISSSAHFEFHLFILKQYVLIDYWCECADKLRMTYWQSDDIVTETANIIDGHNELMQRMIGQLSTTGVQRSSREMAKEKREKIAKGLFITVPIPVYEIDLWTGGGWIPGELTIMAARPAMGKTTIAILCAKFAAYKEKKILFFSLEMPRMQLINKLIAQETGIDYKKIKAFKGLTAEEERIIDLRYDFWDFESNLVIIDDCKTLSKIANKVAELDPDQIWIDYLQLVELDSGISNKQGNREQEVSYISRHLKLLATTHDIPVNALSQLSRSCENRPNKRPLLSDLRESGAIEQDADNVIFLYRDAYYRLLNNELVPIIEQGNMEWIWAKGRDSGTNKFSIHMNPVTFEITDHFMYTSDVQNLAQTMPAAVVQAPKNLPPPPPPNQGQLL